MNSKRVKIKDKEFLTREISVQYSTDFGFSRGRQSCDITIVLDINLQKDSYKFITDLYDNQFGINGRSGYANNYKFNISCVNFIAQGYFKSIDIDTNGLVSLRITSDYITVFPLEERRDRIIDELLNETSNNKNI
jgi:hypothetical protein